MENTFIELFIAGIAIILFSFMIGVFWEEKGTSWKTRIAWLVFVFLICFFIGFIEDISQNWLWTLTAVLISVIIFILGLFLRNRFRWLRDCWLEMMF
jgi:uncharacterized membrane protein YczE